MALVSVHAARPERPGPGDSQRRRRAGAAHRRAEGRVARGARRSTRSTPASTPSTQPGSAGGSATCKPSPVSGEFYLPALVELAREDRRPVVSLVVEDDGTLNGINDRVAAGRGRVRAPDGHQRGPHDGRRDDGRPGQRVHRRLGRAGGRRDHRAERHPARHHPHRRRDAHRGRQPDHRHRGRPRLRHLGQHPRELRSGGRGPDRAVLAPAARSRRSGARRSSATSPRSRPAASSPGVQQHHFSYIGDADLGERTNVGAGTITCNYDGVRKHRTKIGKRVFLGSDTMLVAPVELGDGARTGAGAVVTRDVPAGMLAVGVPARIREAAAEHRSRSDDRRREATERPNERPRPAAAGRPRPRPDRGGLRRGRDRPGHAPAQPHRAADRRGPSRRTAGPAAGRRTRPASSPWSRSASRSSASSPRPTRP